MLRAFFKVSRQRCIFQNRETFIKHNAQYKCRVMELIRVQIMEYSVCNQHMFGDCLKRGLQKQRRSFLSNDLFMMSICHISDERKEGKDCIDKTMKKIVMKLQQKGTEVNEDLYLNIRRKVCLLVHHGCRIDTLPEYLGVFNLSEDDIEEKARKLKRKPIKYLVPVLFDDRRRYRPWINISYEQIVESTGLRRIPDLLQMKLECKSKEEWNSLQQYFINTKNRTVSIFFIVDFLNQHGISLEEIKMRPALFGLSYRKIKSRVEKIKETYPYFSNTMILFLCELDNQQFYDFLSKEYHFGRYKKFLSSCKTQQDVLEKLLNIYITLRNFDSEEVEGISKKNLQKLKKKIDNLEEIGVSLDSIVENIYCLMTKNSDLKLAKQRSELRNEKDYISNLMTNIQEIMIAKTRKPVPKFIKKKISQDLNLSTNELDKIEPFLKVTESGYQSLRQTISFLQNEGYSRENLSKYPRILRFHSALIQRRLEKFRENVYPDSLPPLDILCKDWWEFKLWLDELHGYKHSLGNKKNKIEVLAEILQLDKDSMVVLDPIKDIKLVDVRSRIHYLLSNNISIESIVNNIMCLTIPLEILKKLVKKLQKDGIEKIELKQIMREGRKHSPKLILQTKGVSNLAYFRRKLNILPGDMKKIEFASFENSSAYFEQNIKFLTDRGFTDESLSSCPYIIGHSPELLQEAFNKLTSLQGSEISKDLFDDEKKRVQILQYLIEKDHDFKKVVNISEETLSGTDEARYQMYLTNKE